MYLSDNPNDKGVQCDLGNECYQFYKPTNDKSFEIEDVEEEEDEEYGEEEIVKQTRHKPSINIEENSCFFGLFITTF